MLPPRCPPALALALCLAVSVALCAALPARADVLVPRGDGVLIRQAGGGEIPLAIRVLLSTRPGEGDPAVVPGAPPPPPTPPIAATPGAPPPPLPPLTPEPLPPPLVLSPFKAEGNLFVATASGDGLAVDLRLGWESGAGFTLQARARAGAAVWTRLLAVELETEADGATFMGRDLRPLPLGDTPVALSRFDPKWVTLYRRGHPLLTLQLGDEADGLQLRRAAGRVRMRIDLLAVEARPFFHFSVCTDNWKDPNQRLLLPARLLLAGEELRARATLYPGAPLPLLKARYPEGRRAAFVITDHADQTAARTLRALAGGTSDANDPRWGQTGLLGHGLAITKALWLRSGDPRAPRRPGLSPKAPLTLSEARARPRRLGVVQSPPAEDPTARLLSGGDTELELMEGEDGQADESGGGRPQLDDPQVVALADRLHAAGWEIIPHSATPLRDGRDQTREALAYFRRYSARSWIDHQPYTNCEALINQGYQAGRFGITDLLAQHGYRYAWAGIDMPPGELNLLAPRRLERYVPVVWPAGRLANGMPETLWLFRSMLAFIETQRFFDVYNSDAIDKLERERGLHIAHTYLENSHAARSWFGKRNLMVPGPRPREVIPDPRLEALFSGLAARVARGSLWVPTLTRLGDQLRATAAISVSLESDGSAVLHSATAMSGVTFVIPRPYVQVRVDGQPPRGLRVGEGETTFWANLPAGQPVRVQLRGPSGQPLSFLAP